MGSNLHHFLFDPKIFCLTKKYRIDTGECPEKWGLISSSCNPLATGDVMMGVDRQTAATTWSDGVDERRLIRRILAGDASAERQLYEGHVDRVFRLAYRMTGDRTQAEDLTQDTFIRAFDRLADFRGEAPFGGWLHRVATSVILTGLQKRKRLQNVESIREDVETVAGAVPAGDPDLRRRIDRAVDTLSPDHRLVFVMHDLEGYTHREIATAVDAPVGTVKARLSRARQKLRDALGGPEPELEIP
jgi:RNA polymerase sigma-70 factor (ECF subfamily)